MLKGERGRHSILIEVELGNIGYSRYTDEDVLACKYALALLLSTFFSSDLLCKGFRELDKLDFVTTLHGVVKRFLVYSSEERKNARDAMTQKLEWFGRMKLE